VISEKFISEVKDGLLAHDVPDLWSGFRAERGGVNINGEVRFRHADWLFHNNTIMFSIAPALGATVNTAGGTSMIHCDALKFQMGQNRPQDKPTGLFMSVGLGVAIHDGALKPEVRFLNGRFVETTADEKILGARALFHIPIELGYQFSVRNSVSVYFEHISNGYTASSNEGLDSIGLRYGYRF